MRGTLLVFRPDHHQPNEVALAKPIGLPDLQAAVGGYIEEVPGFTSIAWHGTVMTCIALCNEHAKLEGRPFNQDATSLWEVALRRVGQTLIKEQYSQHGLADFLAGDVVVVFGDRPFMQASGLTPDDVDEPPPDPL